MAIRDRRAPPLADKDLLGTVWAGRDTSPKPTPFAQDAPTLGDAANLTAGASKTIVVQGAGEVLMLSLDLPSGVTADLRLDGGSRRYSQGNEATTLRFEAGRSPYRFVDRLELVITNTTGVGQPYKAHVSGA